MTVDNDKLFEGINQAYYPEHEKPHRLVELEYQRKQAMQMGNVSLLRAVDMVIDFELDKIFGGFKNES